jgi:hypothetical protein
MEILERYPWLLLGATPGRPQGWKIRCNAWGLPLSVLPMTSPAEGVEVRWLGKNTVPLYYQSRGLVGNAGKLTVEGLRFVQLMAGL